MEQRAGGAPTQTAHEVDADTARLDVVGQCTLELFREPLRLVVTSPRQMDRELLVHPLGAFVAAAAARWAGRTALHGAALSVAGRTIIALGPPAAGKSTLAVAMSRRGHHVVADDLVVIDDAVVLAGPPSADLREDAAAAIGTGRRLSERVGRERFRTTWDLERLESPLSAFVLLSWADDIAMASMSITDRLSALGENEALGRGPSRDQSFLRLLGFPFVRLERPRDYSALPSTIAVLEEWAATLPTPDGDTAR